MNNEIELKLYSVRTEVRQFNGCRNVQFLWFRYKKPVVDRPYSKLIENYDPSDDGARYPEECIDEMFTAIEAHALKEYLDREHGQEGTTTIEEQQLPIANNLMGYGARAVGGGDDFYTLDKEDNYSLPFKVWGYFDLVGCELVDEPGETFRHYLMLVGKGECRIESQAEARFREVTVEQAVSVGKRWTSLEHWHNSPHVPRK